MQLLKNVLIFSLLCFSSLTIAAQDEADKMPEKDWETLIMHLQNEEWAAAETFTEICLKRFTPGEDSLATPAILRYMYFRCIGARLGAKEYDKEEAEKKTKDLIGKPMITPEKPFYKECLFNCFHLTDDKKNFYSCASNNEMTIIHAFETYILGDPEILESIDELEGKSIRLAGIVSEIKAGGFAMPRLDVTFDGVFIWE